MIQTHQTPFLIAEDEHVRVIFQPGQSDFLLVTFGDMFMPIDGLRFFADVPVQKLNISCLGFMAKSSNWYPRSSMLSLIDKVRGFTIEFSEIICYGGSMGGYAALKYSKALGSTHVIALCPQWSIDNNECDAVDPIWQKHFDKSQHSGMGIRAADCGGCLFVMFDKFNKTDLFHAQKIHQVSSANLIHVLRVDHHVTPALAGTENLRNLIKYCRAKDLGAINQLVRECRRRSKIRVDKIILFAQQRFPAKFYNRVSALFRKENSADIEFKYAMIGMKSLMESGDHTAAILNFEKYKHHFDSIERMHSAALFLTQSSELSVYITTFHGTVVCYDIGSNSLIHCSLKQIEHIKTFLPVKIFIRKDSLWFFVNLPGYRMYIAYTCGNIDLSYKCEDLHEFKLNSRGISYTLCSEGNYLTAEIGTNKINCDRIQASDWESFGISIG